MIRSSLIAAVLTLAPAVAFAQTGMPGGGGAGQPEEEDKSDGVAEEAPKTPGLLPTTPTLPPPKGKRNKFELFELDGYFRMRADYFKNLNLSFRDDPTLGSSPFPRSLACGLPDEDPVGPAGDGDRPCEDSIKSTNIRLRLEPTVNVNETTSVHLQLDVLDNIVLGTHPTSGGPSQPLGAFEDDQETPITEDALKVRRAWAEVQTPLGLLKFGRQPSHWGLGIWQNSGAEDPINGTYDYDGDYGDDVDRISFSTLIPGTRLRAALAYDWPQTGLWSSATEPDRGGQAFDLDDNDDVNQWVLVISRMDAPSDFRDAVDRGELALNYGVYFAYRTLGWDYSQEVTDPPRDPSDPDAFVPRAATTYTPDAWVKLSWKKLLFEAEVLTTIGSIDRVEDITRDSDTVSVRTWGGVGRVSARALGEKLRFGAEVGAASGDQYDNDPQGDTHISNAVTSLDPADRTLSRFMLDQDYKVDLILFRELIGAVTNAAYGKPWLSYQLTSAIDFKVANITSWALKPIATPGNGSMYGTEFDADIRYQASTFEAGLSYGFFVPLSAMDHPPDADMNETNGVGFDYGANAGSAGNAHTLQLRLVVKF